MIAHYDSEARSLAIDLAADTRHGQTREVATNVIVGIRDGQAVMVEVILADAVGFDGLDVAAREFALDREALHAAANAARSAPDRDVDITVARAAA